MKKEPPFIIYDELSNRPKKVINKNAIAYFLEICSINKYSVHWEDWKVLYAGEEGDSFLVKNKETGKVIYVMYDDLNIGEKE